MQYDCKYSGAVRGFQGLTEIRERFLQLAGEEVSRESYQVSGPRQAATYGSLDDFLRSRLLPEATGCALSINTESRSLHILGLSWATSSPQTHISIGGFGEAQAESLTRFLSNSLTIGPLRPPKADNAPNVSASAFIGYSFDGPGREVADRLAEFLETFGFQVVTGEPFEATRVSDKVKERIREQGVALCIFTKPDGTSKQFSEWVRDEATFASALNKPLFILVEQAVGGIPDIHGDQEYITFDDSNLAPAILRVLQGLKAAGFAIVLEG